MQFTVSRSQLNQALSKVGRLAGTRLPLPILNNILLTADKGKIVLAVTDLELGIQTSLEAVVREKGTFTVPARLLLEFIQATNEERLAGQVVDQASLVLKGDQSEAKIRGLDASEFPDLPFTESLPTLTLKVEALKQAIDMVAYAAAIDDTRPALSGIAFVGSEQELTLAATDSYRLAEKHNKLTKKVGQPFSVIVPKRTMTELARLLAEEAGEVSVFVGDNQIQFEWGTTRVVSRLIEGSYPQYQTIIPQACQTKVTAYLPDFIAALKTAQLFAREAGNLITLTVVPGKGMTVESSANQHGEATAQFTAITEGEELKIAFNVKYLLDNLAAIAADNVFIEFSGADRPVLFRPANNPEYLSLVMPLKLDQ